jgi:hypothetical protein
MNAIFPCGIGGGGDDSPALRASPYQDWSVCQGRVLEHLDRGIEGIQIQMDDGADTF